MKETVLIECELPIAAMMYGEMLQWAANKIPKSQEALTMFHKSVESFNAVMLAENIALHDVHCHMNHLVTKCNNTIVDTTDRTDIDLHVGWTTLRWYDPATEYKVSVYIVHQGFIIHLDTGTMELRDAVRGLPEFFQREMALNYILEFVVKVHEDMPLPKEEDSIPDNTNG